MRKRRPRLAAARRAFLTAFGNAFFKGGLSRNAAFGMKRTRHQLAPAMPGKKIVDRALAGLVPDRLFVGRLEIVDVQQFTCAGSPGKTRQQRLFIRHRHVLAFAPATWLAFQCIEAAVVIGHVSPVHRAQRNSHRFRNRRLSHSALAKQHHLDALALPGMFFPTQRCLQTPNLAFGAFNHLQLRIRSDRRSESQSNSQMQFTPVFGASLPQTVDSISYGSGMMPHDDTYEMLDVTFRVVNHKDGALAAREVSIRRSHAKRDDY